MSESGNAALAARKSGSSSLVKGGVDIGVDIGVVIRDELVIGIYIGRTILKPLHNVYFTPKLDPTILPPHLDPFAFFSAARAAKLVTPDCKTDTFANASLRLLPYSTLILEGKVHASTRE